jgi:hypothetical protein
MGLVAIGLTVLLFLAVQDQITWPSDEGILFALLLSLAATLMLGFWSLRGIDQSRGRLRGGTFVRWIVALALLGPFGGSFVLTFCQMVHDAGIGGETRIHLKTIGSAISSYHAAHHQLPPTAIRGPDGTRLLSWRVAILPHLGEEEAELFKQFNLDEPWDGPHNRTLLDKMPVAYQMPNDLWTPGYMTYFQVLIGPGTAFERDGLRLDADFPDGAASTILVAEAATPVPWTQPADLSYDPSGPLPEFGAVPQSSYRRRKRDEFYVILGDGRPQHVYPQVPRYPVRAAITRNGGDKPDW